MRLKGKVPVCFFGFNRESTVIFHLYCDLPIRKMKVPIILIVSSLFWMSQYLVLCSYSFSLQKTHLLEYVRPLVAQIGSISLVQKCN